MAQEALTQRHVDVSGLFDDPVWAELFAAYCCDARESPNLESARGFRDALSAQNPPAFRQDKLSLRGLRIGPISVSCLGLQLKDRPYTSLDLTANMLGDQAALSLRSLVRALPRLRSLHVAGNAMGMEGAQELSEELESNSVLETLVLGARADLSFGSCGGGRAFRPNAIGASGLACLVGALSRNRARALTTLDVCNTALGPEAGRHLSAFLESDRALKHLDVSLNPLQSEGVCALLSQASRLESLDVSDTGCRGELVHPQLTALLEQTVSLSRLSLAYNPLQARPLRRIARGMVACKPLASLDLEGCGIGTDGAAALAGAILEVESHGLTALNLAANKLAQVEAAASVASLISGCGSLEVLCLARNPIGDAGAAEVAESLRPDRSPVSALRQLDLSSCRIGTVGATRLAQCLADNATLRSLRLSDNFLDEGLDLKVVDGLAHVHDLQLRGNRLSFAALQHCARVVSRNQQRTRDEEPNALKTEMRRLLCQEAKLEKARKQVDKDEAEVSERESVIDFTARELVGLRTTEAETQRHLRCRIDSEEQELRDRRADLEQLKDKLQSTARAYADQTADMVDEYECLQQELASSRQKADDAEANLQDRTLQHPAQVQDLRRRTALAVDEAARLKDQASGMRRQLKELQDRSLIDFRN